MLTVFGFQLIFGWTEPLVNFIAVAVCGVTLLNSCHVCEVEVSVTIAL